MSKVVSDWFGPGFDDLDPLLQALHRFGGQLSGMVDLQYGPGLAGVVGRRLGARMGLPADAGCMPFEVAISHDTDCLIWSRTFKDRSRVCSRFTPLGHYPDGVWQERSGWLDMQLAVEIRQGGWYWLTREVRILGVSLPLWLFPSSEAYKRVIGGHYEFAVSVSWPGLGKLFSYSGRLFPQVRRDITAQ